ncbi:MAG: sulfur carrier protein ThiS [Myxococcota bacterium]|nr:sulfur carrier protein ThiS [Myxococcota bacterium]
MRIQVNGEAREIKVAQSVAELVFQINGSDQSQGIAVAVNGQIVRRNDWAERTLEDNDEVEVLRAVSGG